MKPKDITPGVVYGYKPGKYDVLRPVLIVDNTYWRRSAKGYGHTAATNPHEFYSLDAYDARRAEEAKAAGRTHRRSDRGYSGGDMIPSCGLPGLDMKIGRRTFASDTEATAEQAAETLTRLAKRPDLRDRFAALPYGVTGFEKPKGVRAFLFNPAWLLGEWAEVYGAAQDEAERRRILDAEAKAASEERVARALKRVEALRALDLPGEVDEPREEARSRWTADDWEPLRYVGNTGHVKLTLGQVDALLSLIPDGSRFVPDDVEDDGWTLRRPEYEAESDGEEDDDGDDGE